MYSHSRINCFKQCPKLFQYKYIDKLVPLGADSKALSMGKAFHTGIEHGSSDAALEFMEKDEYFMSQESETDKIIVLAMVDAFLQKFPEAKNWEHEIHLTGNMASDNDFQLYIDGLEKHEDGYYLVELKTASMINDAYINKLDFNDQISRYYYIGEQNGYKILGIKYYVVKKPLLRLKKGEAIEQFRARLVERILEDDSIFYTELHRTPEQIKECIDDTIYDIKTIENTTRYTKNLAACSTYGTCPYMDLCRGVPDAILLFDRKEDEDVTGEQESN